MEANNTLASDQAGASLFMMYGDAGYSFGIIWPAVLINFIGIPGQIMNFLWSTSQLKIALKGLNFIPYMTSVCLQLHAMFGLHASQLTYTCIALDRLLSTALPALCFRINTNLYLISLTLPCFAIGLYATLNCFIVAVAQPHFPVTGHMSELFDRRSINALFANLCFYTNAINVICYFTIGILLRLSSGNYTNKNNRQIYKSLIVIMMLVLGGYLINIAFGNVIINFIFFEKAQRWYMVQCFCALPVAISAASNALVLYFFSRDYRLLFDKELNLFYKALVGFAKNVIFVSTATFQPKVSPTSNFT